MAHFFKIPVKNYELIEHTADTGVKVKAKDLKSLFKQSALAMFDIVAKRQAPAKSIKEIRIKQSADNLEELFLNWLNELLSLSATKELIFSDFRINKLSDSQLEAVALGRSVKDYEIKTEIKAATYHQLKVKKTTSGWQAEVIFDV